MKGAHLAILAVAFLMVTCIPMLASDDSQGEEVTYTIQGYVYTDFSTDTSITPHVIVRTCAADVTVKFYITNEDALTSERKVDATFNENTCKFDASVRLDKDTQDLYVAIVADGYNLISYPNIIESEEVTVTPTSGTGGVKCHKIDEDKMTSTTVWLSSDKDVPTTGSNYIMMSTSNVTVSGIVTNTDGRVLADAYVRLLDADDTIVKSTYTASNGRYSMVCPSGLSYTISITRGGYVESSGPISLDPGTPVVSCDVVLTAEVPTTYFGYDLPHFLMVVAGIVGAIVVVASSVYYIRLKKKPGDSFIYDDEDEQ